MPEIAIAVADALAGGRSVRAALASAAGSVEGPAAVELARLRADLQLGASTADAEYRFAEELGVEVEPLRSPLGTPGENNAGLLGYLRSIARNN